MNRLLCCIILTRHFAYLFFDALETIEVALRTQIIYHFAMEYGSHWQNKPNLYRDKKRYHQQALKIKKEIDRSEEVFIKHYCSRYKNPGGPPSWVCLEVVSIGTLSKLFQNLKNVMRRKP